MAVMLTCAHLVENEAARLVDDGYRVDAGHFSGSACSSIRLAHVQLHALLSVHPIAVYRLHSAPLHVTPVRH